MKKILVLFMILISISLLNGCSRDNRLEKSDLKINLTVIDLLPESIKIDEVSSDIIETASIQTNKYRSESYYKLLQAYLYIEDLFVAYNSVIDEAIKEDQLEYNEVHEIDGYRYSITNDGEIIKVEITEVDTDHSIHVNIEEEDNNRRFYGTHEVNDNIFAFEIINDNEINIQYDSEKHKSESHANIIREDDMIKTHIIFNNETYFYDLVSLANDDYASVLYNFNAEGVSNKYFEVYDGEGYLLYQSLSVLNNFVKASGWHMHALKNFETIEKLSPFKYRVDENEFIYELGEPNLHEVDIRYLTDQEEIATKQVLMLGKLEFKEDITNIVEVRAPFETDFYQTVKDFATEIVFYSNDINNK